MPDELNDLEEWARRAYQNALLDFMHLTGITR